MTIRSIREKVGTRPGKIFSGRQVQAQGPLQNVDSPPPDERISRGDVLLLKKGYFFAAVSATDFIWPSPWSNCPPIILSIFITRPIALVIKFFLPVMFHVTVVWFPCGWKVNSAVLVAANGFMNSSLIRTRSLGWLSMIVMRPSTTLLLPTQE